MLESIFRFLFKYPPLMFQQGDLAWAFSRNMLFAAAGAAVAALVSATAVSAVHAANATARTRR